MASFGAVRDIPIADIRRTLEYMKIATWNVERLKHYKDISLICQEIEKCDADIFVDKFKEISTYIPPENIPEILSAYTKHYEEWWNIQGPFINEW